MALFTEKKVENVTLEQIQLNELPKGESILVYVAGFSDRVSEKYGDFQVVESLVLDIDASSVSEMISSSKGGSFIPNIMLQNMITEGKIYEGGVFRIEKAWDQGDKFAGGKQAKGYGYNVFELSVDKETKTKMRDNFLRIKAGKPEEVKKCKEAPRSSRGEIASDEL